MGQTFSERNRGRAYRAFQKETEAQPNIMPPRWQRYDNDGTDRRTPDRYTTLPAIDAANVTRNCNDRSILRAEL